MKKRSERAVRGLKSAFKQRAQAINSTECLWLLAQFCFLACVAVAIGIVGGAALYEYRETRFEVFPPAQNESLRQINGLSEQLNVSMNQTQVQLAKLQDKINSFNLSIQQIGVSKNEQLSELMAVFFSTTQELSASLEKVKSNVGYLMGIDSLLMEIQNSSISKIQQLNVSLGNLDSRLLQLQQEQLNLSLRIPILRNLTASLGNIMDRLPSPTMNFFSQVLSKAVTLQQMLRLEYSNRFFELASTFGDEIGNLEVITSCAALSPSSPPGYYVVRDPLTGSAARVYCGDMERQCGHVGGNWVKIANLDMKNYSQRCPSDLMERNDTYFGATVRTCVRKVQSYGCSSVTFSSKGLQYSGVCGKITGFHFGNMNSFNNQLNRRRGINSPYVDGVSVTHGNPREHIWTFALGIDQTLRNEVRSSSCPCINLSGTTPPPAFVGENYFCDSGPDVANSTSDIEFYHRHVWAGRKRCLFGNLCCNFNRPPFFYRQLPQRTSDSIEVRVCGDEGSSDEDVLIESVELYVQ